MPGNPLYWALILRILCLSKEAGVKTPEDDEVFMEQKNIEEKLQKLSERERERLGKIWEKLSWSDHSNKKWMAAIKRASDILQKNGLPPQAYLQYEIPSFIGEKASYAEMYDPHKREAFFRAVGERYQQEFEHGDRFWDQNEYASFSTYALDIAAAFAAAAVSVNQATIPVMRVIAGAAPFVALYFRYIGPCHEDEEDGSESYLLTGIKGHAKTWAFLGAVSLGAWLLFGGTPKKDQANLYDRKKGDEKTLKVEATADFSATKGFIVSREKAKRPVVTLTTKESLRNSKA